MMADDEKENNWFYWDNRVKNMTSKKAWFFKKNSIFILRLLYKLRNMSKMDYFKKNSVLCDLYYPKFLVVHTSLI